MVTRVVNDNMRGLVLSSAACEAGQRPGQAAADRLSKWFVRIIKLRIAVNICVVSVRMQLESSCRQ